MQGVARFAIRFPNGKNFVLCYTQSYKAIKVIIWMTPSSNEKIKNLEFIEFSIIFEL